MEIDEVRKVHQVNQFHCTVARASLFLYWKERLEQIECFIAEDTFCVAPEVLLEGHLNNIQANIELELLVSLVVIDNAFRPNLRKTLRRDEEVWPEVVRHVGLLQLAVDLISYLSRSLLDDLEIFIFDSSVLQERLGLFLEVEELRQLYSLQLLEIVDLILTKTVHDHLELVDFVEDGKVLEAIKFGVELVDGIDTLVHPHDQLTHALSVVLLEEFELVDMHELVGGICRPRSLVSNISSRSGVVPWRSGWNAMTTSLRASTPAL